MSALRVVGSDQAARFRADMAEVTRRMRKREAARTRAATPDAVTYPGWRVRSPGASYLDRLSRPAFYFLIVAGCALWWVVSPKLLAAVMVGLVSALVLVKALRLSEEG